MRLKAIARALKGMPLCLVRDGGYSVNDSCQNQCLNKSVPHFFLKIHNGSLVINTGPLLALVAALGNLEILRDLYRNVHVPFEVYQEIRVGGVSGFAVPQFESANWWSVRQEQVELPNFLANALIPERLQSFSSPCWKTFKQSVLMERLAEGWHGYADCN